MRKRSHGQTKKGWWPLYGFRYARVLTTTWLRERHRRTRRVANSWLARSRMSDRTRSPHAAETMLSRSHA